jgi:hypothetical protein
MPACGATLTSQECLQFAIGYIVGRIGAGETNLELLEDVRIGYPATMIWAATLPALYRPFYWGQAFDGLGRLVLRELTKPLHPRDMPSADISLDELRATMNPSVEYKRLPFRTAQRTSASVEIAPGVVHSIGLQRTSGSSVNPTYSAKATQAQLDFDRSEARGRSELQSFIRDLVMFLQTQLAQIEQAHEEPKRNYRAKKPSSNRR